MDPRPWLNQWDPNAKRRIVCLGPAGRGTSDFHVWRPLLPGGVEISPIVLAGRERRLGEPPARTWNEVVEPLADRLADLVATTETVIYGHSMGAWLGYELVRAFQGMGVPMPLHLVVAARRAPQVPDPLPSLSGLDDPTFLDAVDERYGAIPAAVRADAELMSLVLPALRADFALLDRYVHQPGPGIDVPITALLGHDDTLVDAGNVEPWGELTSRTFQIRHVEGGHFFLRESATEVTGFLAQLFRQTL